MITLALPDRLEKHCSDAGLGDRCDMHNGYVLTLTKTEGISAERCNKHILCAVENGLKPRLSKGVLSECCNSCIRCRRLNVDWTEDGGLLSNRPSEAAVS